ncbi:MAG: hypothetical protein HC781_20280 [Leptolyngbyaceae cyanobacterium CSU_1_4]|nr:hypothetical protein [Leptolyngbyaceae cyanobacterium CSU_1_4]
MCKLCAIAAWHPRVRRESLVFNLSQLTTDVENKPLEKPLLEPPLGRSLTHTQEKSS